MSFYSFALHVNPNKNPNQQPDAATSVRSSISVSWSLIGWISHIAPRNSCNQPQFSDADLGNNCRPCLTDLILNLKIKKLKRREAEGLCKSLYCLNIAARDVRWQPIIHTSGLYVVVQRPLLRMEASFSNLFWEHVVIPLLRAPILWQLSGSAAENLDVNHTKEGPVSS